MAYLNIIENEYTKYYLVNEIYEFLNSISCNDYNICEELIDYEYSRKYMDVTKEWLLNATPNSHKILDRKFYISESGIKYDVDNKNVIISYSNDEKDTALWLENTLGGELYINPKINKPDGIKSADYYFRGNNWDMKSMKDATSKIRAVDNAIKNNKNQSKRFILDITGCKLSNSIIIKQAINIFTNGKFNRDWVQSIMIIRNKKLIKILIKK